MTTHKCTFCPKPASTTVLAVGPNGRRQYPACEKCAAEKQPKPTPANAFTAHQSSGGWYIALNGNLEHPYDYDMTEAEAKQKAADLNAAMDGKLFAAGFDGDRRKPSPQEQVDELGAQLAANHARLTGRKP